MLLHQAWDWQENPNNTKMMSAGGNKVVRVNSQQQPAYIDSDSEDQATMGVQQQAFPVGSDQNQQQQQIQDGVPDDVGDHLRHDMFKKTQTAIFDIDIVASPAELAENQGQNIWRLAPHLHSKLKYNTAIRQRDQAVGEQLAGNLNRCIPLQLKILQQTNSFPYFMGIRMPGIMMDKTLHSNGACVWRVPPETGTMMVGEAAFDPVNIVNRYAYDNYRMCTIEDLQHDVTFTRGRNTPARSTIAVNSLAYETLKQSLQDGNWAEQLHDVNVEQIFNPGRNQTVEVTEKIGKDILNFLTPQVQEAADSFVNLEDMKFEIVRAEQYTDFKSPKNLIGEIVSNGPVDGKKINSTKLQTRCVFAIKAELTFVLF